MKKLKKIIRWFGFKKKTFKMVLDGCEIHEKSPRFPKGILREYATPEQAKKVFEHVFKIPKGSVIIKKEPVKKKKKVKK